ncbi:ABC transporter ATP-binding protein [Acidomonas methanolica]|uniref:ABC transporter ATP-binding protein n=1 Tax=Acidomonas methanolica TaxID=437 RepID=UPI001C05C349|nr:ABC transporter ATP-binding protein [Acidomonas methanolica]MBU2654851.1 ABC transporter ATP-binding protein [Acidomonas methanolica]
MTFPFLAFDSLALEMSRGERVALLAESAAELARLSDLITGQLVPSPGTQRLAGTEIDALPPWRRAIGLVSPRFPLLHHLDLAANLAFPLRARSIDRATCAARVNHLLALTRLDSAARRLPRALSAEETFRALLARALAPEPSLLLLETPFDGLDPAARRRADSLLGTLLPALNITTLLLTTEREDALRFGGRIAILADGRVVQIADPATLFDRPAHLRVAVGFGGANALPGQVQDIVDDIARVRLRDGAEAEGIASPGLTPDAPCLLCVRPDRIAPHFGPALVTEDGEHLLAATLQETLHMGDHIRLRFRLADGSDLVVSRPPLQSQRPPRPGARAQLAWPAAQAVAFPMPREL